MAGIQTHPHPGLVPHFVYDALQLREVTAHCRALATHVLQHWPHWGGTEKRPPLLLGHTHRTWQPQHLIHMQNWLCLHLFIPEAQSGDLFFLHRLCVFSGIQACSVFLSYKWHLRYVSQIDCSGAQWITSNAVWCQLCSQFWTFNVRNLQKPLSSIVS